VNLLTLVLAAEEGAEGHAKEGINKILPQGFELFWGTIMFLLLFFLLWKFAFPAIKKGLENRAGTIEGDLKRAEEAKLEAEELLADYRKQLASAKDEAAKIIEEGRKTADELKKELLAKAEAEASEIIEAGRRDVEGAVASAQAELRRQMADLSVDLAGRIIGRELDAAGQQQSIEEFMAELDSMEAGK
jgi:F-type H+-transporting ATPase subunit b